MKKIHINFNDHIYIHTHAHIHTKQRALMCAYLGTPTARHTDVLVLIYTIFSTYYTTGGTVR